MSQKVQRVTDQNSSGAAILTTPNTKVYAGGLLVAVDGSTVAPHLAGPHLAAVTANGSSKVFIGGIPVTREGDLDSCADARVNGSTKVFLGA